MALSIDWGTKRITLNQGDTEVSHVSGTTYELDTYAFFRKIIDLLDEVDGMPFPDVIQHFADYTISGITYVDAIAIVNGYTLEVLPDSSWRLRMDGASNNNYHDEGILVLNDVQVIPANSAGNTITETGVSGLTTPESDALLAIDANVDGLVLDVVDLEAKIDLLLTAQDLTNEQQDAEHTTSPTLGIVILRNTVTSRRWEADAWEDEAQSIRYQGSGLESVGQLAEVAWS